MIGLPRKSPPHQASTAVAKAQANEILGDSAEPAVKAQYEGMLRKREQGLG
jgi:hypothetical protein